jgi:hypothetical protein
VLSAELPWTRVAIGAGRAIAAELARIPALPFAVGVYLPVTTMVPVFLGGALRWFVERRAANAEDRASRRENGVLFGSGLVGGEGLMGVLVAGAVGYQTWRVKRGRITAEEGKLAPLEVGSEWAAGLGAHLPAVLAIVVMAGFILYFARRCRSGS